MCSSLYYDESQSSSDEFEDEFYKLGPVDETSFAQTADLTPTSFDDEDFDSDSSILNCEDDEWLALFNKPIMTSACKKDLLEVFSVVHDLCKFVSLGSRECDERIKNEWQEKNPWDFLSERIRELEEKFPTLIEEVRLKLETARFCSCLLKLQPSLVLGDMIVGYMPDWSNFLENLSHAFSFSETTLRIFGFLFSSVGSVEFSSRSLRLRDEIANIVLPLADGNSRLAATMIGLPGQDILHDPRITSQFEAVSSSVAYHSVNLLNGVSVQLISSSSSSQSSLKVRVDGVGHVSNPRERPGLAHLTEHLLSSSIQGSVGDNLEFFALLGGSSSACTRWDFTEYSFSVSSENFAEALAAHSQIFTRIIANPKELIPWNLMASEIEAISTEWSMVLNNHLVRINAFLNSISFVSGHSGASHYCGNTESLKDVSASEIVDFIEKWYSSGSMTLEISGSEPISRLRQLAIAHFSTVANRGSVDDEDSDSSHSRSYDSSILSKMVVVAPPEDSSGNDSGGPIGGSIVQFRILLNSVLSRKVFIPVALLEFLKVCIVSGTEFMASEIKLEIGTLSEKGTNFSVINFSVRLENIFEVSFENVKGLAKNLFLCVRLAEPIRNDISLVPTDIRKFVPLPLFPPSSVFIALIGKSFYFSACNLADTSYITGHERPWFELNSCIIPIDEGTLQGMWLNHLMSSEDLIAAGNAMNIPDPVSFLKLISLSSLVSNTNSRSSSPTTRIRRISPLQISGQETKNAMVVDPPSYSTPCQGCLLIHRRILEATPEIQLSFHVKFEIERIFGNHEIENVACLRLAMLKVSSELFVMASSYPDRLSIESTNEGIGISWIYAEDQEDCSAMEFLQNEIEEIFRYFHAMNRIQEDISRLGLKLINLAIQKIQSKILAPWNIPKDELDFRNFILSPICPAHDLLNSLEQLKEPGNFNFVNTLLLDLISKKTLASSIDGLIQGDVSLKTAENILKMFFSQFRTCASIRRWTSPGLLRGFRTSASLLDHDEIERRGELVSFREIRGDSHITTVTSTLKLITLEYPASASELKNIACAFLLASLLEGRFIKEVRNIRESLRVYHAMVSTVITGKSLEFVLTAFARTDDIEEVIVVIRRFIESIPGTIRFLIGTDCLNGAKQRVRTKIWSVIKPKHFVNARDWIDALMSTNAAELFRLGVRSIDIHHNAIESLGSLSAEDIMSFTRRIVSVAPRIFNVIRPSIS